MADIDYNGLFGLATGENEQAPAEPAQGAPEADAPGPAEQGAEGGNEQAPAEPADDDKEKPKQGPEENAKYAAARRKAEAERDRAVAEARAAAEQAINEAFRQSGLKNPFTGKQITNQEEYNEYQKGFAEKQRSRLKDRSGMEEDEFSQTLAALPEVVEAQQRAEEAERKLQQARRQSQMADAQRKLEEQVALIHALDPSIQTAKDLTEMENYDAFYQMVQRGYTMVDAYKLANLDKLTARAASASAQAARNSASGKDHLQRAKRHGTEERDVPPEIMAQYRLFNPDATEADIRKHYNDSLRG